MQKSKSEAFSIRIDDDLIENLRKESSLKHISVNGLINKILRKHSSWHSIANRLGWLFISKRAVGEFLKPLDKKTVMQIGETLGKEEFRNSVEFAYGNVNFETVIRSLENWMVNTKIKFNHLFDDDKNKYVIEHEFGRNWSIYFITTVESLMQDIGYKFKEKTSTDRCCSFEIVKAE